MKTFIIKYIFYLTSLTDPPTSQILVLEKDSVTYWDYDSYKTKEVLYKRGNVLIVKEGWIVIKNNKIRIRSFRRRETIEYKIKDIVDQDQNTIKGKPNPLY